MNIILSTLDSTDIKRNTKLKWLDAEIRNLQSKVWRNCSTWKIGNNTYNELGAVWTELNEFRIT